MKNYYSILDIQPNASNEQIRKSYRKMALKYHPDRNHNNPAAAEKFREAAEAYGVLADPVKRSEYDSVMRSASSRGAEAEKFSFSQEKIFEDLFNNPQFQSVINELLREVGRSGVRCNRDYLQRTFTGGRGFFFGGIFIWGGFLTTGIQLVNKLLTSSAPSNGQPSLQQRIKKVGQLLFGAGPPVVRQQQPNNSPSENQQHDLHYSVEISPAKAACGTEVKISLQHNNRKETLNIKIPPGTSCGQKLRLKGRGREYEYEYGRGDLYLTVIILNK